jgi:MGT family glycosyltransferase
VSVVDAGLVMLFLCQPFHGHVHPMLGLAEECARRGHEVAFVAADSFHDVVAATGAEVVPYDSPLAAAKGTFADLPPDGFAMIILAFLQENRAILDAAAKRFPADPPDVIVYDLSATISANILRRAWDRPVIQMFPTFATDGVTSELDEGDDEPFGHDDPYMRQWQCEFDAALAQYGLTGTPEEVINPPCADVNLVTLPSTFQPFADRFDDRFHFVGPLVTANPGTWPVPARPLVLVSLGTVGYEHAGEFLRTCLEAFADTEFQVVLTTPLELGPVPPNAEVHRWVPQLAVLRQASVFVSHAGATSAMQALLTRTPVVAIPQQMDQPAVAERLRTLGLGTVLQPDEVTAGSLLEAVRHVASDPTIAANLREMSDQIHRDGGAPAAADVVEKVGGLVPPA